MPKGYKYKGTHWTQRPENRDRVIANAKHRSKFRQLAKSAIAKAKRGPYKRSKLVVGKPFVIRTHGYRIILDKNEIRIENE